MVDPDEETAVAVGHQTEWMRGLGISASEDTKSTYVKLVEERAGFAEISKIRRELAESKIPMVLQHTEDTLAQKDKVIIFAHHHVMLDAIFEQFKGVAARITGHTTPLARTEAVRRFQEDPACKLFVGSIQAAGVGITLTASDHVIFAELDWVPANMLQAESRPHRIGQKNGVLIQYLVVNGSLDARIVYALVDKIKVIERTLGKEVV